MKQAASPTLLLLGGGYSLIELTKKLESDTYVITTTSAEKREKLKDLGAEFPEQVSITDEAEIKALFEKYPNIQTVIDSVPPLKSGSPTLGVETLLSVLPETVERIFYLSTTGVYGKTDGSWVTEETECTPFYDSSVTRVAVEELYRSNGSARVTCFRLSGIYGPGRGVGLSMKRGKYRLVEEDPRRTNRIHVEDIAGVLERALHFASELPPAFNVNDDLPAPANEVYEYYREKFNVPEATVISKADAKEIGGRMVLNQQVSNALVKEILDYSFRYPSYKEGAGTEFIP